MSKTLITGTSSGFGKFLYENIDSIPYIRETVNHIKDSNNIIHCGWDSKYENIGYDYIDRSINFIQNLLRIPHKKFIFISTIDVYPKDKNLHEENENIDMREIQGIYGLTKYLAEQEVKTISTNYLILRCSSLVGKYTKNNALKNVFTGGEITLSNKSTFNIILYDQVLEFIKLAIEQNWNGIFNIVGTGNISLKDLGHHKNDGFKYITPRLSDSKFLEYSPKLVKTSYQNWETWIKKEYSSWAAQAL